jgi:hypothetical protein
MGLGVPVVDLTIPPPGRAGGVYIYWEHLGQGSAGLRHLADPVLRAAVGHG